MSIHQGVFFGLLFLKSENSWSKHIHFISSLGYWFETHLFGVAFSQLPNLIRFAYAKPSFSDPCQFSSLYLTFWDLHICDCWLVFYWYLLPSLTSSLTWGIRSIHQFQLSSMFSHFSSSLTHSMPWVIIVLFIFAFTMKC